MTPTLATAAALGATLGAALGASAAIAPTSAPVASSVQCPAANDLQVRTSVQLEPTVRDQERAVVAMIPQWPTIGGTVLGNAIAANGHQDDRTEYVIWNRTYWPRTDATGTEIVDRGSPTANAQDHVLIVIDPTKCSQVPQ